MRWLILTNTRFFCCQFDLIRDWRGRIVRWDRGFGYHGSNCTIPCWQMVFHLLNRGISGAGAGGEARAENGNEGCTGRLAGQVTKRESPSRVRRGSAVRP